MVRGGKGEAVRKIGSQADFLPLPARNTQLIVSAIARKCYLEGTKRKLQVAHRKTSKRESYKSKCVARGRMVVGARPAVNVRSASCHASLAARAFRRHGDMPFPRFALGRPPCLPSTPVKIRDSPHYTGPETRRADILGLILLPGCIIVLSTNAHPGPFCTRHGA